ncbi:MAG: class I SAM-dependent methyltransferase [Pseudomonadota bacterium]
MTLDAIAAPDQAEAFAERIAGLLDGAAVAVMLSLGHKTGLLDRMAILGPATSQEIADAAGLDERYVREWLAVMVTGGVVLWDPQARTYRLPPEHAACLTRGAPLGNLAVYAQTIPMIGACEETLLDRFRHGGGTRYDDYPCFHQFMAEDSEQTVVAALFDTILPLADGLTERLEGGADALDAGCGRGEALLALAQRFPRSRFTGYDLCADAVAHANARAREAGLSNIRFEQRDLSEFDERAAYDFIASFDAIHDQKDPQDVLRRYRRALRSGGTYLVQDIGGSEKLENNIGFPMASFLYAVSCAHCMPISLGQGGEGLGTMWGWETAERMLREAGFETVERTVLEHDPMNVWFVAR